MALSSGSRPRREKHSFSGKKPSELKGWRRRRRIKRLTAKRRLPRGEPQPALELALLSALNLVYKVEQYFRLDGDRVVMDRKVVEDTRKGFQNLLDTAVMAVFQSTPPSRRAEALSRAYEDLDRSGFSVDYYKVLAEDTAPEAETELIVQGAKISKQIYSGGVDFAKAKCIALYLGLPKMERRNLPDSIGPYSARAVSRSFFAQELNSNNEIVKRVSQASKARNGKIIVSNQEAAAYRKAVTDGFLRKFRALYATVPKRERLLFLRGTAAYAKSLDKLAKADALEPKPSGRQSKLKKAAVEFFHAMKGGLWAEVRAALEERIQAEHAKLHG